MARSDDRAACARQGQAEALILLTGTDTVETIYGAIAGDKTPEEIDTEDIAAAVHAPASRSTFLVVTDEDELAEMLALPLAQWRTLSQYAHVLLGMQAEAAELVRSIVAEAGSGLTA